MPVILRVKGYKFWFYEADLVEPSHIHVGKGGKEAKYWLEPIAVARAGRFKPAEINEIERIIKDNYDFLLTAWKEEQKKRVDG
jgi:hypothetical protein